MTIVSTEVLNAYSMTATEIRQLMSLFSGQKIPITIFRLNAMNEWSSGNSSGITKAKEFITIAKEYNIDVAIDLHTWYTTWDNSFAGSGSTINSNRTKYISYVQNVITAFSGSNVNAFMVLNEPQARKASAEENQFILDIVKLIINFLN